MEEYGRLDPLGPGQHRCQGQCKVSEVWGYWWHKLEEEVVVAAGPAPPYGERLGADEEEGGVVQESGDVIRRGRPGRSLHGCMKMVLVYALCMGRITCD